MIRGFAHQYAVKPPPPFGSCERYARPLWGDLFVVTERARKRDGQTFTRAERPMRRDEVIANFPDIEFREGGQV